MPFGLSSSAPTHSAASGEKPASCCQQCITDGPCCRIWQSFCDSASLCGTTSCCCSQQSVGDDTTKARPHTRRHSATSESSGSYERESESCWWWCFLCDSSQAHQRHTSGGRPPSSLGLRRYSSQSTTLVATHSQRSLMIAELLKELFIVDHNSSAKSQPPGSASSLATSDTLLEQTSTTPSIDLPSRTWWKIFGGMPIGDEGLRLCVACLRKGAIVEEEIAGSSSRVGDADSFSSPVVPAMNARRYESVTSLELHDQNLSDVITSPLLYELLHDTFPNLTALSLCRNALGSACSAVLASHLRDKRRCRLKSLHFSGNPIGCEGFEKIVSACTTCKSLQRLEIGDTQRSAASNFQLINNEENFVETTSLTTSPSLIAATEALCHVFTTAPLKEFRLVGPLSWMRPHAAHDVILSARFALSLEELVLLDVLPVDVALVAGAQHRMYQSLPDLLRASTSLTKLTIRQNIDVAGSSCIAEALIVAVGLRYLSLSRCGLDSHGLVEIARGLALNRTVLHLDVSYPDASAAEAMTAVAAALESNHTLQQLTITGMDMTEAILQCLCSVVVGGGNKSLVSVVHSPCECDASHRLHSLLEANELQWKNSVR